MRAPALPTSVPPGETASPEWVAWFNTTRLLEPLGYVAPAELEAQYGRTDSASAEPALK